MLRVSRRKSENQGKKARIEYLYSTGIAGEDMTESFGRDLLAAQHESGEAAPTRVHSRFYR